MMLRYTSESINMIQSDMTFISRLYVLSPLFHTIRPEWTQVHALALRKKATIHQLNTMLATTENVLFSGNDHLLTTGSDDLTL